jgi:hypothetical protein
MKGLHETIRRQDSLYRIILLMKDHAGTMDTLYALSVDPAMSKFTGLF